MTIKQRFSTNLHSLFETEMGYKGFVILMVDVSTELNLILFALCEITKQQSYELL